MDNPIGIISMQFTRPFTGKDLHYVAKAAELGFDFVELLVPEPEDNLPLADVRKAAEDAGMFFVLAARVNPQRSIASEVAANRQGGIDYLKRCVETASEIGADIVGGPLYGEPMVFAGRPPVPRSDAEIAARAERTISGLAKVAPIARAAGVTFALEALNRFETDIVSTTRQAVEVVDAVGDKGLGVMLDTFHMNMEERSVPDAIRLAGNRIVHFQANENHRGHPGTGHLDWPAIMRALHQVDYRGPISLEPFRRDDDRVGLPIAHWRAPREDESAKLRAGLGVIRNALTLAEVDQ
ncbi:sugar phosphate isomerase/epimerase family protein [Paracoccus saliphilus]|uniref:D-tagatose 3-epimerase n=1 Tax=Paracoccus saliphilus TaxID=405559 RepID=A0AA45W805_9RHOB|nr:sugar phosphate isomerase/epimerase family protein [Paracoccus saliphilus]WCR04539.1 sugar phosphate isomerase/epimerase [Paracoccus saliphilus]SIT13435.1 D-tagatose 3-epimerase [Paracoccus saliphilus]